MMEVYVCYECYYNGRDMFRHVVKVVDSLAKAMDWEGGGETLDADHWRDYELIEVE